MQFSMFCVKKGQKPSELNSETNRLNLEILLLRKEVIQPHLPIRLPCYDFTPIANPTFDGSFHKWLGHRLRVLLTLVV